MVQGFQGIICIFLSFGTSSVPFRFHLGSKSGGTFSFGIDTWVDWNLNWSKISVLKKSCGSFGIFGFRTTLNVNLLLSRLGCYLHHDTFCTSVLLECNFVIIFSSHFSIARSVTPWNKQEILIFDDALLHLLSIISIFDYIKRIDKKNINV